MTPLIWKCKIWADVASLCVFLFAINRQCAEHTSFAWKMAAGHVVIWPIGVVFSIIWKLSNYKEKSLFSDAVENSILMHQISVTNSHMLKPGMTWSQTSHHINPHEEVCLISPHTKPLPCYSCTSFIYMFTQSWCGPVDMRTRSLRSLRSTGVSHSVLNKGEPQCLLLSLLSLPSGL